MDREEVRWEVRWEVMIHKGEVMIKVIDPAKLI